MEFTLKIIPCEDCKAQIISSFSCPYCKMVRMEIRQKEMQEKLDAAIEVIKFYADIACPLPEQLASDNEEVIASSLDFDRSYYMGGKRARDFLKARGE